MEEVEKEDLKTLTLTAVGAVERVTSVPAAS